MSNDSPRPFKARRRALAQLEGLEDRALLSGVAPHPHDYQFIQLETPGTYVSQQVSAINVTLNRYASPRGESLYLPLTVQFSASLDATTPRGDPIPLPASSADTFIPVNESVTFPAGVTKETVQIPVNSGAPSPGSVPIKLTVPPTPGLGSMSPTGDAASAKVYLVTGPAALPPTPPVITNSHLIVQGKTVSGIAITFSKPMAPATVENVHNYAVTKAGPTQHGWDFLYWQPVSTPTSVPVRLLAAHYDPTTNTVTLIPRSPLKASALYTIQSPYPFAKRDTLTDQQGTPLEGNVDVGAQFEFDLKGHRSFNSEAPQPATIFNGN